MAEKVIASRYRLGEPLGRGGMASVWAAEDLELERRVAVKLIAPQADTLRFEREARTAASLAHPNICRLYDFGRTDDGPYMVLELLSGDSLESRLATDRPLPDEETARIAGELADGLAHAHAHGLIHRDLKPANVLFDDDGRAKISDFGIARAADASTLTDPGTVLGTAGYLSPEQARGAAVTSASDVYSFGIILYQMLTGRLPFVAETPIEQAAMRLEQEPVPITEVRSDVPAKLAALATAALARDPEQRPTDGAALLAALQTDHPQAAAGDAETVVLPTPARAVGRRRTKVAAALAALAALAAGGIAVALIATDGADDTPGATTPEEERAATTATTPETTAETPTTTEPPTATTAEETTTPTATTAPTETEPVPPTETEQPPPTETEPPPPTETEPPPPTETEPVPTETEPAAVTEPPPTG